MSVFQKQVQTVSSENFTIKACALSFTGTARPWSRAATPEAAFSRRCKESGLKAEDCTHAHTHTQTDVRTHKHYWTAYGPFSECRTQKLMFEAHQAVAGSRRWFPALPSPDSHHLLDRLSGVRLSWWSRSTQLKHCYLHSLWFKKKTSLFLKSSEVGVFPWFLPPGWLFLL